MKRDELMRHAKCNLCGKGIASGGLPLFYRVTVERFGVDVQAARRQDGLGAFMGSHALAAIMGPDEDLAKPVMEPRTLTVCELCGIDRELPVVALSEFATPSIGQQGEA